MKSLIDTLASAVQEGSNAPLTAHNEARAKNLGESIKRTMQQGNQVGALVAQLSVLNGMNKAGAELKDLNDALENNVAGAQEVFDKATPDYVQATLSAQQAPEQLGAVQENTSTKELSAPADTPTPNEVAEVVEPPTSTEVHVPVEGVNLTLVQNTSDSLSGGESIVDSEEAAILQKISTIPHLHGYNLKPNGKCSLMDLSTTAFADLFAHFRGASSCTDATDEEKEIFTYLDGVKTRRNGMKMQKTG